MNDVIEKCFTECKQFMLNDDYPSIIVLTGIRPRVKKVQLRFTVKDKRSFKTDVDLYIENRCETQTISFKKDESVLSKLIEQFLADKLSSENVEVFVASLFTSKLIYSTHK